MLAPRREDDAMIKSKILMPTFAGFLGAPFSIDTRLVLKVRVYVDDRDYKCE
jgi:hypothetical protein